MPSLSIEDPFLGGGARVTLCAPFSHCQDKGNSQNLRAGLTSTALLGCAGSLERWYRREKSF